MRLGAIPSRNTEEGLIRSDIPILAVSATFGLSLNAIAQPVGFILPDEAQPLTPHVYLIYGFPTV